MKIALYFLALLSLSQAAALVRWADAPADVIGFWRLAAASLLLLPLVGRPGFTRLRAQASTALPWTALAAIFFFAHLWTYVYSAQNTRIANCLILYSVNPLFTSIGNRIFFGGRLAPRVIVSYLFALTGIFLLVRRSLSFEQGLILGDLSAIVSGLFFSCFLLSGKKVLTRLDNPTFSMVLYAIAGLLFGLLGLTLGHDFLPTAPRTWAAIGGMVLFPTLLGHALFTWLMKSMDLNLMSCGKLLEPVLAAFVAALVFGETVSTDALIAFAFTGASILILFAPWRRRRPLPKGRA